MSKFKDVEYTNQFQIVFLLVSTVGVFSAIIFILNRIINLGLIKVGLAFLVTATYYLIFRKKFTVKTSDFELTSRQLKWNNKTIDFNDLEYYKIHWMKGAGIKFKFKDGKTLRISLNDNFCNSEHFVSLCHNIDAKLLKFNNGEIERKKSFFESKKGYYYAIIMTVLVVAIIFYKLFTDEEFNFTNIALILVTLTTIWRGVRYKRKK